MKNKDTINYLSGLLFFELYAKENENKTTEEIKQSMVDILQQAHDLGVSTGEKILLRKFEKLIGTIKNEVYDDSGKN